MNVQAFNHDPNQLAMRFGPSRSMFGFLVCRRISDKDRAFALARDILSQDRKYVIPIDDDDLTDLVAAAKAGEAEVFELMQKWHKRLTF